MTETVLKSLIAWERSLRFKYSATTGQPFNQAATGEYVAGAYRQRFALTSSRFAMIDDGLGFQLVPWTPSLEKQLGRHVSGIARDDGGIDWGFGRSRGAGDLITVTRALRDQISGG
jgi:hypothetical protein